MTPNAKAKINSLIKAIHTGKRDLNLEDDNYRALLMGATGKDSCKKMSIKELEAVLSQMRDLGFSGNNKSGFVKKQMHANFEEPQYKLAFALWQELHENGAVKNKSAEALNAYIKRMCPDKAKKCAWSWKTLRGCYPEIADSIIESLKKWINRSKTQTT